MKLVLSMLVVLAANFAYANETLTCAPELGEGEERVDVSINWDTNTAQIFVNSSGADVCGSGKVSGEFVEYGEATVKVSCAGKKVTIEQNYDETVLDISSLKLGLSDTRFMCN